ncbi:MAG: right-handed parallel beta-helix repeat-containing protein [Flavobacteriales bacterium]
MRRSAKRTAIGPWPLVSGLLLPLALLMLVFSVADHGLLAGEWPMGISSAEVDAYAKWLDVRPEERGEGRAEIYRFGGSKEDGPCMMEHTGPGWTVRWFEADGYGDSVEVRRLRTVSGGFVVKFKRDEPFRAQRHIVLMPASVESMRAKYLEVLAGELGLVTPEVSFVRVIACGRDLGIFRKEERIDTDLLEKQRMADGALFEQGFDARRPDHLYPAFDEDTLAAGILRATLRTARTDLSNGYNGALYHVLDRDAAVARLLMHVMEQDGFREEDVFAYRWSEGRVVPLYRPGRGPMEGGMNVDPLMWDPLLALMSDVRVREALSVRWEKLMEVRWRLRERFLTMDRAWLPLLAPPGGLAMAAARTARIRNELLGDAMAGTDPLKVLDRQLVDGPGRATFEQDTVVAQRYWPALDDARMVQRIVQRYKASVQGDTIVFPRGRYQVDEDLVLPFGKHVVLLQGARFELAAGVSVICQGSLQVRGTARNPVFVRALRDGAPFGTFAVLGDKRITCSIRGLQLDGGSEARICGAYFSGQLAVHGAAYTEMVNCVIGANAGEDAVNVKGGRVLIQDCVFENGQADLVDLDHCTGRVFRCTFRSGRKDSNGDGLDVSGARMLVEDCLFQGMMDKGISVGEASQLLVRNSRFEGNARGVVAKDLSIAHVIDNVFTDNGLVFAAYRKKPIYGGARLLRYANVFDGNRQEQETDALSEVVSVARMDDKVLRAFAVE